MGQFEKTVESHFKNLGDFSVFLNAVKRIRNFLAHSYNITKHYDWHTEFAHKEMIMEDRSSLRNHFKELMRGVTNNTIKRLKKILIYLLKTNLFQQMKFVQPYKAEKIKWTPRKGFAFYVKTIKRKIMENYLQEIWNDEILLILGILLKIQGQFNTF